jgi:hypothetical protein
MARAKTKEKTTTNVSKTESILLTVSITIAGALIVAFGIWLIIFLVGKKDDKVDAYKDYISITTSQLNIIVDSNLTGQEARYQDLVTGGSEDNKDLLALLQEDGSKHIYVLFYSNDPSLYTLDKSREKERETINKTIEDIVVNIKPDKTGNVIFLLYEYSGNSSVFENLDSKLKDPKGNSLLPPAFKNTGGPALLKITSIDHSKNKTNAATFVSISGASNLSRVTNELQLIVDNKIDDEVEE